MRGEYGTALVRSPKARTKGDSDRIGSDLREAKCCAWGCLSIQGRGNGPSTDTDTRASEMDREVDIRFATSSGARLECAPLQRTALRLQC